MKKAFLIGLLVCSLLVLGAVAQAHGGPSQSFSDDDEDHDGHDHAHGDHGHSHGDHGHSHGEHSHSHSHSHSAPATPGKYEVPRPTSAVFFEPFDDKWSSRWTLISSEKYNGHFTVSAPTKNPGIAGDKGLLVPEKARHYAAVAKFPSVLDPTGKDLVIQYEVRLQDGLDCGGAYLKVLTAETLGSTDSFSNDTPYTIMFGPDKCGSTSKVHFIFRHQNPVSKEYEEKHMKNPPAIKSDKITHLYTLHVRSDNTFAVYIDEESVVSGSLLDDFEPAVNPSKEIDDPSDKKPSDWVDEATIADPDAKKSSDWDESAPASIPDLDATKPEGWLDNAPAQIADPTARKPADWDDTDDGEWIAPLIPNPDCEDTGCGKWERPTKPNPAYKGKWSPPQIANPAYKGVWAPRKIANPSYFEDKHPANFKPIAAIGIEIWTMSDGILFDNILVTTDKSAADKLAKNWKAKYDVEKANEEPEPAFDSGDKAKTLLEKAQDLLNDFRRRLDDPYVFWSTMAAAALPLVIMLVWPSKPTAPAATPAATPAAASSATAAPTEAVADEKKSEGKGKKKKKSEQ